MSARVVIVDDQPLMRAALRDCVDAEEDLTVVGEAGDGASAVELAERLRPDVVVMDVRMPGRDGVAVVVDSGAPPPPVILMTAYAVEERLQAARDGGVHAVLQKPFAAPHLLDVLAGAVAA